MPDTFSAEDGELLSLQSGVADEPRRQPHRPSIRIGQDSFCGLLPTESAIVCWTCAASACNSWVSHCSVANSVSPAAISACSVFSTACFLRMRLLVPSTLCSDGALQSGNGRAGAPALRSPFFRFSCECDMSTPSSACSHRAAGPVASTTCKVLGLVFDSAGRVACSACDPFSASLCSSCHRAVPRLFPDERCLPLVPAFLTPAVLASLPLQRILPRSQSTHVLMVGLPFPFRWPAA